MYIFRYSILLVLYEIDNNIKNILLIDNITI